MSNVKKQTIDVLILEELLANPSVTAEYLSKTWGEDVLRCYEWLKTFKKKGLCFHDGISVGPFEPALGRFVYTAYHDKVRKHLSALHARKS